MDIRIFGIKYTRFILNVVVVFTLTVLWLSGCGGEEKMQEEAREQAQRTWESENVSLDFYTWSDEENYVSQVVEAYNSLKGREAVRLHIIPNDLHEQWIESYIPGVKVDLIGLRGNTNLLALQDKGVLLDLSPYIHRSDLDVTAYGNMYNEIEYEGGYYGLPARSTSWVLYYNKELFDAAGVPYPEEMTWEEYLKLSQKMFSEEGENTVWGGYYLPWIYHMSAIQKGCYLLDDDLDPIKESLALTKKLYDSGSHVPYEIVKDRDDDNRYDFEEGNIAMLINGEWLANMLLEDEEAGYSMPDWDIAPLPVPEGVEKGTTVGMYQFVGMTTACEYPEEAFEFLKFLCGEEGAEIYARNGIIPAWSNEEIRQIYADSVQGKNTDVFFETQRIAEQPMWKGYNQMMDMFKKDAELYIEEACTLDEAMEAYKNARNEVFGPRE